ncbi:MAG: hypothetical protein WBW88_19645 [Rhodothermales bacterium]
MNAKGFFLISGIIFAAIAIVHLVRLFAGWPFVIGSFSAPTSISIGGVIIFGAMSIWAFRLRNA